MSQLGGTAKVLDTHPSMDKDMEQGQGLAASWVKASMGSPTIRCVQFGLYPLY